MKNVYEKLFTPDRNAVLLKWWYVLVQKIKIVRSAFRKRHVRAISLTAVFALSMLAFFSIFGRSTFAQLLTLTTDQLQSEHVDFNQVQVSTSGQISLQEGDIGQWENGYGYETIPANAYIGAAAANGPNGSMYYTTAVQGCKFFRYNVEPEGWEFLKSPPEGCGYGTSLTYDESGSIYFLPANDSSGFYRYDVGLDEWIRLADIPSSAGNGAAIDYAGGSQPSIYLMRGNLSSSFYRYDIVTDSWEIKTPFPAVSSLVYGVDLEWNDGGKIYAITGNYREFMEYSIIADTWTPLTRPGGGAARNDMVWTGTELFLLQAQWSSGGNALLKSYSPATDTWTDKDNGPTAYAWSASRPTALYDGNDSIIALPRTASHSSLYTYSISQDDWPDAPLLIDENRWHWETIYDGLQTVYFFSDDCFSCLSTLHKHDLVTGLSTPIGGQLTTNTGVTGAHQSNNLYLIDYSGGTEFTKFDLTTNSFTNLPAAPAATGYGTSIVDGGDGYLYATFTNRRIFYRFSEAGGWEPLTSAPDYTSYGSDMTRIGNNIYIQTGNSRSSIMRYDILADSWTNFDGVPSGGVTYGGVLVGDESRYIYSVRAQRTAETNEMLFRLDTNDMSWSRVANLPASTNIGASGFYDTANDRLYVAPSISMADLWSWVPTTDTFTQSGDWYSDVMDLTQVDSWNSLNATVTGTGITAFWTRTSDDGNVWLDWQQTTGTTINSVPKQFLQIRVSMTGDGTDSPIVEDINVDYEQETTAPTLPSQLNAYDQEGGAVLNSGQAYEHQHPYFEWQGSDDGATGSGIEGYYVYYGTDSNADPEVDGNFQETANYTVTTAMTADDLNYLRIKVKDKLGNVSAAATFFTYRYFYISPPAAITNTTQADFAAGINYNVDLTATDEMKLRRLNDGSWSTGPVGTLPTTVASPAATYVDGSLYVLAGSSQQTFWRYNTLTQVWDALSDIPAGVSHGSTMTWDKGNYIYASPGNAGTEFYRYNIQTDVWEALNDLPLSARAGTDIKFIGDEKIGILFSGVAEFYVYDIVTGVYESKTAPPLAVTVGYASSGIWFDGDDTLYAFLGPSGSALGFGRQSMVKYSVSEDVWRELAAPSQMPLYTENNLTSDGQGNLYVFGNDYTFDGDSSNMAAKYNIATNNWESLQNYEGIEIRGTATSDDERYIYILPAYGFNTKITTYDSWEDQFTPFSSNTPSRQHVPWSTITSDLWNAGTSSTMAYDGVDDVYMIGANQGDFGRFVKRSVSTGEITEYVSAPYTGIGGSLEYMDGELYYLPGNGLSFFFRFDQVDKIWVELPSIPVGVYRPGSGTLTAINGSLYAFAGNTSVFYRYDPTGLDTGTWTAMSSLPGTIETGSAIYDGTHIYAIGADSGSNFYRYDPIANTWASMANLPATAYNGTAMTFADGKIYASSAPTGTNMYVYTIATDTWVTSETQLTTTPSWGATFEKINEDYALYFGGNSDPNIWQFNFPKFTQAYRSLATHESQVMQMNGIFDYAGITAQVDTPANTRIELWSRTSNDSLDWSNWQITEQVKTYANSINALIASDPDIYLQTKVILYSDDGVYTPTLIDYTVDYYFDIDPPTNPGTLEVFSDDSKITPLASNTWYNHQNAHFDWPDPGQPGGATDGLLGSRIKGYWVYIGTDPTASPVTAGVFVPDSEYTVDLLQSNTYYVRIQTEDITGNVSPAVFAPFNYRFDNTPPTKPALISVTPSGFTSIDNFTFDWPNAFDEHSGISMYCYRTGALSGPFAVETCQPDLTLADVPTAYQQGTNVFYVRTLDIAGNYSDASTEVSYYYSTAAPGPVANLQPIPPIATQNLFSFVWDLPVTFSGDPNGLNYCYSINVLPSNLNTVCTSNRFIEPGAYATQQGTNVLYVVAEDEAGNANYTNYASTNFSANTTSPGFPLNLAGIDTSDQEAERWSITLTWDTPTFVGNGIDRYIIERSEDNVVFSEIGSTSNQAFVDLTVLPNITYYYRTKAADAVDTIGSPSSVISQDARGRFIDPPVILVEPTADPSFSSAEINWVTNRDSTSFVEYGKSPSALLENKGSLFEVASHSVELTGLESLTRYYYRVQSFDIDRNYNLEDSFSQIYSFTTTDTARVFDVEITDATLDSALLSWKTSVPTKATIEYGQGLDYGFTVSDEVGFSTNHVYKLDNLKSGTDYHFRFKSETDFGSVVNSDDYTVTTLPFPAISNIRFQPVADSPTLAVRVTWDTNTATSSVVKYSALSTTQEVSDSELSTQHETIIVDLAGSSDYTFTIQGRDQYGTLATSDLQRWQSQVDTREPEISDVVVDVTTSNGSKGVKAQAIVSWRTDEPATSQVSFTSAEEGSETQSTELSTEPTVNHVVVISGLDLSQVYNIQARSTDISGNESYGAETVTVTPDVEISTLETILTILQRIF